MRRLVVVALLAFVGGATAEHLHSRQAHPERHLEQPPVSVVPCPDPAEVELVAVTPDGSRVYRIKGAKMIVPMWVVESKAGAVAVR